MKKSIQTLGLATSILVSHPAIAQNKEQENIQASMVPIINLLLSEDAIPKEPSVNVDITDSNLNDQDEGLANDSQTINAGENPAFAVTFTNNGEVDLTDVTLSSALTPDCNRTIHQTQNLIYGVGNNDGILNPGENISYICNGSPLQQSYTNEITVNAVSVNNNEGISDSDMTNVIRANDYLEITEDPSNPENEHAKNILAGDDEVVFSFDVQGKKGPIESEEVIFTIANTSPEKLQQSIGYANLYLDNVLIAQAGNGDIGVYGKTNIIFEDISDLIIPEENATISLGIVTNYIGEDSIGTTLQNLTISQVEINDIEDQDNEDLPNVTFPILQSSKEFSIVPAIITPSVVSTFGIDDNNAEVRVIVDSDGNTTPFGGVIQSNVIGMQFEINSLQGNGGTIEIFNGFGSRVASQQISNGFITVPVSNDTIGNDDETYRIEVTGDASYRLANVQYTTNSGDEVLQTQLENTLDLGNFQESN